MVKFLFRFDNCFYSVVIFLGEISHLMWNVVFSVIFLTFFFVWTCSLLLVIGLSHAWNSHFQPGTEDSCFVMEMKCDKLLVLLKLRRGQQP